MYDHFGQIVAVAGGGACIVVSAGLCAGIIIAGGVANAAVIYAQGGSGDEQALNGVATVIGAIPAVALVHATAAATHAGIELMPSGIEKGVNAFVGMPSAIAGLIPVPESEAPVGC